MKLLFICTVAILMSSNALAFTLVKDGKSDHVIVLAKEPLQANRRAAQELQRYVKQISGAELPIVDDSKPAPAHAIFVGPSTSVGADKLLGNDGFTLSVTEQGLLIAGPGPRGSMYGVYELLERLGVRWFTPTVTRVPKQSTIELPDDLNVTQIPAFEYREPYFTEAQDKDWAARNRIIGQGPRLDASSGGSIKYAEFVHTLDNLVPRKFYDTHPEYFPEIGGKRVDGYVQRCLSNPEVLKLAIAGVKKAFADHPDAGITSVSQNDVDKWCRCEKCAALEKQFGSQSGVYLWFVNQVAEAIEKDYPEKLIDTLAYQFTEAPPKEGTIAPRKNVRVRLCPIGVCQAHPYEKDDFPDSKAFVARLAAWHKIAGDTLYIWHYTTDFAHYLQPFPDFNEFPAEVRLYARSGVKGVFFQGAYAPGGGGSDAELRSWVMSKLLWNPAADADKLVTEWMQGVYGKAAGPMRQWFDLLHQRAAEPAMHFNCYFPPTLPLFDGDTLSRGDRLFEEAEKLAAGDTTATQYVAKNRLSLRYVKVARGVAGEDVAKFAADCRKAGIQYISEGQTLDAWEKAKKK